MASRCGGIGRLVCIRTEGKEGGRERGREGGGAGKGEQEGRKEGSALLEVTAGDKSIMSASQSQLLGAINPPVW